MDRDEKGRFVKGITPWNKGKRAAYVHIEPKLEPSKDLAYILGILKSDGSVYETGYSRVIKLVTADRNLARAFVNALRNIGLNPGVGVYIRRDRKRPYYVVRAFSSAFFEWYQRLNLEDIMRLLASDNLRRAFIRGFFDGDGSLTYDPPRRKYMVAFYNTRKDLIKIVKAVLLELGFESTVWERRTPKGKPYYHLHIFGKEKVLDFVRSVLLPP